MSLYGMMRTGSSGMNAQASRLSTVADNIANASTNGYKAASTEFSSLLLPSVSGNYNSGAVSTDIRYGISQQGALQYTSSSTDLAISGNGFFVVQDASGVPYMTRAGGFVPNAAGELVNAGGYKLLGYPYTASAPAPVVNGFDGLVPVKVGTDSLVAKPTTHATFSANLDAGTVIPAAPGPLPSSNDPNAEFTHKSSLKTYDTLGNEVLLDMYYTKTADNTWELSVFDAAGRDPASGGFPYANASLLDAPMEFDPSTGKLVDPTTGVFTLAAGFISNMEDVTIDMSKMTQLSYDYSVQDADVNGNAPSEVEKVQVSGDGTVYAQYENGDLVPIYRLAMATVQSPDELRVISGNVYAQSVDSGVVVLGFPGNSGFGEIVSGALENSTVDLASELTTMIESQRTYTANSKVFQTGSDLMDVLVNLKR
ncbi:flagellar hook protein FlgE [Rhizobium sp. KVB221]|uniref:Flagellar hook protein FlgE n=1 Tax=Rhizobium setariae TaxID=2801340 RepID=A0A936YIG4_9HYPH|nr:flagellar hook protein FlgE [Rhizobium setariae]MBL0370693.1 flagellar hook protein FlgE [Rhizobium setariae]